MVNSAGEGQAFTQAARGVQFFLTIVCANVILILDLPV